MLDIPVERSDSALQGCAAKVARLRADAQRWGWTRVALARLAQWLRNHAGLRFYRVNLRPLDRRPPAPDLPRGVRVCRVPAETLLRAARDPGLELDGAFTREALARGDLCFGALVGGRLVSYAWRSLGDAPARDGMWVRVAPPCHYAYKAFTLPGWRGKRLHIAVSLASDEHFRARGDDAAEVGFNEVTNYAICAAADYLGRRRIGYAGYLTWFGRRIPFRTRPLGKIGFEFFEPARPRRPPRAERAAPCTTSAPSPAGKAAAPLLP